MTPVDICNRALAESGTRSQLPANGGVIPTTTQEGLYCSLLYAGLRDFLLRKGDYDFALKSVTLSATVTEVPWAYGYGLPNDYVRLRSLIPSVYNPLNPLPIQSNVFTIGGVRVVGTNGSVAGAIYTSNAIVEDLWDAEFVEAMVKLLSSALTFALESKLEASREKLTEALSFAGIAELRDG